MLQLLRFIQNNDNWEQLLTEKPYCLKIKRDNGYIIFSYNQIESDFYNAIVRECRGIILDEESFQPVCIPFFKFGNYGEGYTPNIDWKTARTQEKIDGSIIKVWFHKNKWQVSTNNTINAYTCPIGQIDLLQIDCDFTYFGELFDKAKEKNNLNFSILNKNYTYMFELVSPYNKVVVDYDEIDIYHIGTRDNTTLEELDIDIGIKKPKNYNLQTLEECIKSANSLSLNKEGYVVVDKNWNRIKIKSPQYVALHHIKNNNNIASIIQLIKANEIGEFLIYFPEFSNQVEVLQSKINEIISNLENGLKQIKNKVFETQKDFALAVKDKQFSAFYFNWQKNNALTPKDWLYKLDNNKIKKMIEQ